LHVSEQWPEKQIKNTMNRASHAYSHAIN
jgi:hypothetical protein